MRKRHPDDPRTVWPTGLFDRRPATDAVDDGRGVRMQESRQSSSRRRPTLRQAATPIKFVCFFFFFTKKYVCPRSLFLILVVVLLLLLLCRSHLLLRQRWRDRFRT